ncbi:amidohydrolase family protein [Salibacterium salarium]|uniref:amidohydrolase family protein n=1 Tax=Salibacterium salarium TaxID=284579 RepID=UPI001C8CB6EA|nr:amidohydrolase family protein [Salibacterium salarium]
MHLFDAHLHIIDPRFPIEPNQGYTPPVFRVQDYVSQAKDLSIKGGAVVSGSFQGYDQTYLTDALARLGPGFVGVTQLPPETTEKEVLYLNEKGVRGIRFNLKRGGEAQISHIKRLAESVYHWAGWHTELYMDAAMLKELRPVIKTLPAVSIDHLGLTNTGFETLLSFAAEGGRVKATGFGRVNFDVKQALQLLYRENPEALLFGTDLPSTRAPRSFRGSDIAIIKDALGEKESRQVLYKNAKRWYRIE